MWGHGGSYGGFETSFLVIPEGHAVFAALTNSSNGGQALHSVEDAFFDRLLGVRRRPPEPLDLPVATLEGFTGSYANSDGWLDVALAPGGLAVTFEDGEFAARPIGERTFEITQGDRIRERFDFPLEGFGRFGSRLAERIA